MVSERLHTQFVLLLTGILEKHYDDLAGKQKLILDAVHDLQNELTDHEAMLIADVVKFLYPESDFDDRLRLIELCGLVKSAQCYQVLKELDEENPELIEWVQDTRHSIMPKKR
jgi:hypothetical protein